MQHIIHRYVNFIEIIFHFICLYLWLCLLLDWYFRVLMLIRLFICIFIVIVVACNILGLIISSISLKYADCWEIFGEVCYRLIVLGFIYHVRWCWPFSIFLLFSNLVVLTKPNISYNFMQHSQHIVKTSIIFPKILYIYSH